MSSPPAQRVSLLTHRRRHSERDQPRTLAGRAGPAVSHQQTAGGGFFATKIDDIAAEAPVAPATVYAVTGGKQGLIRTLIDLWSQAPVVAQTSRRSRRSPTPTKSCGTAAVVRSMRETYGDIIRLVLSTAQHSPEVAEDLRVTPQPSADTGRRRAHRRPKEQGRLHRPAPKALFWHWSTFLIWFSGGRLSKAR
jgi:AcrR family transcriptional regulator